MTMGTDSILNIAAVAFGLFGFAMALAAMGTIRRWQARCTSVESSVAAMRRESEHIASISLKTGRRVKRIEQEYSGVAEWVELRGSAQSFDQAISQARRGADPGKLAQQFGLSRGEADLVARLHGRLR